jgi:hypothetical protein
VFIVLIHVMSPLLCLGRGFAKGEGFNVMCIIEGTKSDRNSHA